MSSKVEKVQEHILAIFRDAAKYGTRQEHVNAQLETVKNYIDSKHFFGRSVFGKQSRQMLKSLIYVCFNSMHRHDLTLAYEKDGVFYCVHKDHVAGTESTDLLHNLATPLTSAEWNALPKYDLWVSTGSIYKKHS